MPVSASVHWQIAGIINRPRKPFQPKFHLKIIEADCIGSGLKPDPTHRGASYLSREQLMEGKVFTIKGGDGIERKLLQAEGSFNDKTGIFEYTCDNTGREGYG